MSFLTRLPPGTPVMATDGFGPIVRGQVGMVTERQRGTWLPWRRTSYACTFLGGIHVTATGWQIMACDHGISRQMLEDSLWFLHTRDVAPAGGHFAAELRRPMH